MGSNGMKLPFINYLCVFVISNHEVKGNSVAKLKAVQSLIFSKINASLDFVVLSSGATAVADPETKLRNMKTLRSPLNAKFY